MKTYLEFINENDDFKRSVTGMGKFGIDADYKLYMCAIYSDKIPQKRDDYKVHFFSSKNQLENFIEKEYGINPSDFHSKCVSSMFYNVAYIEDDKIKFMDIGDGTEVNLMNNTWQNTKTHNIFGHDKIYYVYEYKQNTIGDSYRLNFDFALNKSELNPIIESHKEQAKREGSTWEEYQHDSGEINLQELINGKTYSFEITAKH